MGLMSDVAGLRHELLSRFPEFTQVRAEEEPDALILGEPDGGGRLELREEEGEWTLHAAMWHGHFPSLEEAIGSLAQLLRGDSRVAAEYRGDAPSATWREHLGPEGWQEPDHQAAFLSPFDPDEWELWPGERWKVVRTSWMMVPETGTILRYEDESSEESSEVEPMEWTQWLSNGLGPACPGMKWTTSTQAFVFQAPKGWRRGHIDHEANLVDLAPQGSGFVLRARNYFRELDEMPAGPATEYAVRPGSVEYASSTTDENWHSHSWTMLFFQGNLEMMGILELFYPPGREDEVRPFQEAMAEAAPLSLFTPDEWDMQAPPE
jgi:hypothetical protein